LKYLALAIVVVLAGALSTSAALAGGDAELGKKVFNKCIVCHDAIKNRSKVGPSLLGVVGRKAGTLQSFGSRYSEALIAAGEAGLVWDEANLAEYLHAPKEKVPGNRMAFAGLAKDGDVANVIAYLKADPKP
jgi:cytochrome c